jgi:hypothetical protein
MTRGEFMAAIDAFAAVSPVLRKLIESAREREGTPEGPRPSIYESRFGGIPFRPSSFEAQLKCDWLRPDALSFPVPIKREIQFSLTGGIEPQHQAAFHSVPYCQGPVWIRVVAPANSQGPRIAFEFRAFIERVGGTAAGFLLTGFVRENGAGGHGFQIDIA